MTTYRLDHLAHLTAPVGIYEHARYTQPMRWLGCCTDDNARLLVLMSREPDEGVAQRLGHIALQFVLRAQADNGLVHNRFLLDGYWRWVDAPSTGDHWGRALWGLGVAAARHPNPGVRSAALWAFEKSARWRSSWLRATAFATLGAADVLMAHPTNAVARQLLLDSAVDLLPSDRDFRWPEARLSYANAAIPEALIAAGLALDAHKVTRRGLSMLDWLLDAQTRDGHLSVVGVGGRDLDEQRVQFDQQPIEVAAIADACWRAWAATGDSSWAPPISLAAEWFEGNNDSGWPMQDLLTGGAYDGLEENGRNLNEGAESTLALVSTMQRAAAVQHLVMVG